MRVCTTASSSRSGRLAGNTPVGPPGRRISYAAARVRAGRHFAGLASDALEAAQARSRACEAVVSLDSYLELTPQRARAEWLGILGRQPRKRQVHFVPVEVILCYGLFWKVDPHRYGGSSMGRAPKIVHQLADLFVRPPSSITSKMMNLDGSRANAGKFEWAFFVAMANDPSRFSVLYSSVIQGAREVGITAEQLPDFLDTKERGDLRLLGQEELVGRVFEQTVEIRAAHARLRGATLEQTVRIAEHNVRLGQHRFATSVLEQYDHTCGFCGFAPHSLPGNRLLIASHVKPWADSDDVERLDPRNGVAACPTHDAAFDSGLITINGGQRLHRSPALERAENVDSGVRHNFRDSLRPALLLPAGSPGPDERYLHWHHEHIFQGVVAA